MTDHVPVSIAQLAEAYIVICSGQSLNPEHPTFTLKKVEVRHRTFPSQESDESG